ncbi:MAG: HEPN domain-containing protein [Sulfolobaceae archaeon]|nr:HEPN domain-containing protein [Sulfolobaceae archaeon]
MSNPDFLCRRANRYYLTSVHAYNNGFYDVSYFLCVTSLELLIKATLLLHGIDYKYTHNLRMLLSKFNDEDLNEFVKVHRKELDKLSKARKITSYSDIDIDSNEVYECLTFVDEFFKLFKDSWNGRECLWRT